MNIEICPVGLAFGVRCGNFHGIVLWIPWRNWTHNLGRKLGIDSCCGERVFGDTGVLEPSDSGIGLGRSRCLLATLCGRSCGSGLLCGRFRNGFGNGIGSRLDGRLDGRLGGRLGGSGCLRRSLRLTLEKFRNTATLAGRVGDTLGFDGFCNAFLRGVLVRTRGWRKEASDVASSFLARGDHHSNIGGLGSMGLDGAVELGHGLGRRLVLAKLAVAGLPALQVRLVGDFIAGSLNNQVETVVKLLAAWGFVVDEHGHTVLATPNNRTHTLHKATNTRNLQTGSGNNQDARAGFDVGVHHGGNGLFIGVVLVIENDARAHTSDSVTAETTNQAGFVVDSTLLTSRRVGLGEHLAVEVSEEATLLADHLLNAAMQLNGDRPVALDIQRNISRQGLHLGFDAIDVLGVESFEAAFGS